MQETREFNEGKFQYTLWLDWTSGKCRIAKIGCTSGHRGATVAATLEYGEKTPSDLGWEDKEFATAEGAEEFVRQQHRRAST